MEITCPCIILFQGPGECRGGEKGQVGPKGNTGMKGRIGAIWGEGGRYLVTQVIVEIIENKVNRSWTIYSSALHPFVDQVYKIKGPLPPHYRLPAVIIQTHPQGCVIRLQTLNPRGGTYPVSAHGTSQIGMGQLLLLIAC